MTTARVVWDKMRERAEGASGQVRVPRPVVVFMVIAPLCGLSITLLLFGFNPRMVALFASLTLVMIGVFGASGRLKIWDAGVGRIVSTLKLDFAFVFLLFIGIISLLIEPYSRPLFFYLVVALMASGIFFESMLTRRGPITLLKIVCVSLVVRLSVWYKFPPLIGGDSWYHTTLLRVGLETGNVARLNFWYSEYPLPHINMVAESLIASLDIEEAYLFGLGFPLAGLSILLIFLLARDIVGERPALLGSLMLALFPFHIWYSNHPSPLTFAMALFPLVLWLSLRYRQSAFAVLAGFLVIVLSLCHPLAAAMIMLLCAGLAISAFAQSARRLITGGTARRMYRVSLAVFLILSCRVLFFSRSVPFDEWVENTLGAINAMISALEGSFLSSAAGGYLLANPDPVNEFLDSVGFSLFMSLSISGYLILFNTHIQRRTIIYLTVSIPFCSLILVSTFFSLPGLIPYRWLGTMAIVLSPMIGIALATAPFRLIGTGILTFVVSFFLVTTSVASFDSPVFVESTQRWAYMSSELEGGDFAFEHSNGSIYIDGSYIAYFRYLPFTHNRVPDSEGSAHTFVVRAYILDHPYYNRGALQIVNASGMSSLDSASTQAASLFYDNGNVQVFEDESDFVKNDFGILLEPFDNESFPDIIEYYYYEALIEQYR